MSFDHIEYSFGGQAGRVSRLVRAKEDENAGLTLEIIRQSQDNRDSPDVQAPLAV